MKYGYSLEGEEFIGDFDSREKAKEEFIKHVEAFDIQHGDVIYTAECIPYKPSLCTAYAIEELQNDAYNICRVDNGWLDNISDVAAEDLQVILNSALDEWFKKYPVYEPDFYKVENIEEDELVI